MYGSRVKDVFILRALMVGIYGSGYIPKPEYGTLAKKYYFFKLLYCSEDLGFRSRGQMGAGEIVRKCSGKHLFPW